MFWNAGRIFIHCLTHNILINFWIIFLKNFQFIFSWWVNYSFPVIFICQRLNFWCNCCRIMRKLPSSLAAFTVRFSFFNKTGESIYHSPSCRFVLWHLQGNILTQSEIKSLPFINSSKPVWYLQRRESKSSWITYSALL